SNPLFDLVCHFTLEVLKLYTGYPLRFESFNPTLVLHFALKASSLMLK
ncbi:hypothetical protein A2U01_0097546, partial [Trifolium medium]|nr:hypothetical protein [Trifolium medium]